MMMSMVWFFLFVFLQLCQWSITWDEVLTFYIKTSSPPHSLPSRSPSLSSAPPLFPSLPPSLLKYPIMNYFRFPFIFLLPGLSFVVRLLPDDLKIIIRYLADGFITHFSFVAFQVLFFSVPLLILS